MSTVKKTKAQEEEKASRYTYDAAGNAAYQDALSNLNKAKAEKPTYAGTYEAELKKVYGDIENRAPFKYSVYEDPLYKQYEDRYTALGQRAMRDTVGQAASLTGGYGNTYAESVGQQQYGAYLEKLFDITPELYNTALDRYTMEGDALRDRFSMLGALSDREYGRYTDALAAYQQNVNALQDAADTAYDRGYQNWYDAQKMAAEAEQFAYQQAQDAYDKQFKEEQWAYQKALDEYEKQLAADRLAFEKEVDAYTRQWNEQKWAYEKELDALDRADREREKTAAEEKAAYERQLERFDTLSALISKSGYVPTAEELNMAGMSESVAAAYRSIYENSKAGSGSAGGSGSSSGSGEKTKAKSADNTPFTGSTSAAAKQYLTERGISASGIVSEYTFNTKRAMYLQNPGRSDLGNPKDKGDVWAYYKSYDAYIKDYVNSLVGKK